MMKRNAAILLSIGLFAAAAHAAPPESKDACLDQSFALAEKAATAKLGADAQTKVEGILSALEAKCVSGDFAGAEGDIKSAEAEIAGK